MKLKRIVFSYRVNCCRCRRQIYYISGTNKRILKLVFYIFSSLPSSMDSFRSVVVRAYIYKHAYYGSVSAVATILLLPGVSLPPYRILWYIYWGGVELDLGVKPPVRWSPMALVDSSRAPAPLSPQKRSFHLNFLQMRSIYWGGLSAPRPPSFTLTSLGDSSPIYLLWGAASHVQTRPTLIDSSSLRRNDTVSGIDWFTVTASRS